ncbi:class B sortase [Staphylococcus massiliensis]|uniref:class B sortase n=1 Tax=Staphylococcus massiliensis TaxID=555791 RepID=UPI001EE03068|nr:class B sortase [Staphylococcus massiliensis]MCG3400444.1 class B sortase [Staphylococcus massiliensis]MCG3402162.1 class B sortase [Staphylococcus massiliensis]MCG3412871.1 class B sortase [Staphylococcus massiliensis]
MKILIRFIQISAIVVIIYASFQLYMSSSKNQRIQHQYETLQQTYTFKDKNNKLRPQFEALKAVNKDIHGWLHVEGTSLNYPVLQSKDNLDYLKRDFNKEDSHKGSLFFDYRNNVKQLSYNTIIYGHHVGDGTMFDILPQYLKQDFYKLNPNIQFDTQFGKYRLEVLSAFQTSTNDNYIQTRFTSKEAYRDFLYNTLKKSVIHTNVGITEKDKLITLSTCEDPNRDTEKRVVVVCKCVLIEV